MGGADAPADGPTVCSEAVIGTLFLEDDSNSDITTKCCFYNNNELKSVV
jgi:hypothetical protein